MSLESRLALEPLEVDLPMMTSSLAGQEQDEWLRDGCLSVIQVVASWSCIRLPCYLRRGLPVHLSCQSCFGVDRDS